MRLRARALTLVAGLGAAALALSGCAAGGSTPEAEGDGLRIVTTTTQLDDFARQIAEGTGAQVTSLIQPGASVHGWEPSPADLEALRTADVVIENGLGLEPWLEAALDSAQFGGTRIDASAGFDPESIHDDHGHAADDAAGAEANEHAHDHEHTEHAEHAHDDHATEPAASDHAHDDHATEPAASDHAHDDHATEPAASDHAHDDHGHDGHGHDHDHGDVDPHVWTSPDAAKLMVENVAHGLAEADAANAASYEANAESYSAQLQSLHEWIRENIRQVPEEERLIVTNHEAMTYFNAEYHVTQVGSIIPSWDDNAEPSAAQLEALVAAIKEHGVKAIFTEQQLSPDTAEAIAQRSGAEVFSGERGLYTDSLGPAGSTGDTYVKSQLHNVTMLMEAWEHPLIDPPAELQQ